MTKLLAAALLASLQFSAHAESRVTYVGDGRYACQGSSSTCAQIDANNRQRESQRAANYQRDQDRAQAVVDRERRRDDERREERYRNR